MGYRLTLAPCDVAGRQARTLGRGTCPDYAAQVQGLSDSYVELEVRCALEGSRLRATPEQIADAALSYARLRQQLSALRRALDLNAEPATVFAVHPTGQTPVEE